MKKFILQGQAQGFIDYEIGNCMTVNPGPFRNGRYAIIKITGENSIYADLKQIIVC